MSEIQPPPHPIQPFVVDANGILRYKSNKLIEHVVDEYGLNRISLSRHRFPDEDYYQLVQLLGMSVSSASAILPRELDEAAHELHRVKRPESEARLAAARSRIEELRDAIRGAVDDLETALAERG